MHCTENIITVLQQLKWALHARGRCLARGFAGQKTRDVHHAQAAKVVMKGSYWVVLVVLCVCV
jgi:hypothetical protein